MIDVGDVMRAHEEKDLCASALVQGSPRGGPGLAREAQAAENQMHAHKSHQMDCWRKFGSGRTAVVGEEETFTRVREIVYSLCVLSSAGVSAVPVSGVGLPSPAWPPAVMESVYHTSGFLRLPLH